MKILVKKTPLEHIPKKTEIRVFSRLHLLALFALSSFLAIVPLGSTNADFHTQKEVGGAKFATSCWSAPSVPVHVSPANNSVFNYGASWLNTPLFDWQDSTSTCGEPTITYDIEIYLDANLTNLFASVSNVPTSQYLSTLSLDGTYYWRVRAVDQQGHASSFSAPWKLTIARTTLTAPQMLGWNLQTQSAWAGEQPIDLVCNDTTNGGDVNLAFVSHHWTSVTGAGIKYQLQVRYPSGAVGNFYYAGPSYTNFWYLGSYPGIQGSWNMKVRAFVDQNGNGRFDAVELASGWSNDCNLTLDKTAPQVPPIVLNEIFPSPQGDDTMAKPDGEWVELYNRSSSSIDVNGWTLYDNDNSHALVISSANSDNNLNPFDAGETTVPANGFLRVYRNGDSDFDLEDTGDSVRLFNGPIGVGILKDAHTYGNTAENKSIARISDGTNNWVDPVGTPGRKNVSVAANLVPSINTYQQDQHHLQVGVFDAINYQQATVTVTYFRDQDGQQVQEQFTKVKQLSKTDEYLRDLFMGSVSSSTEYPHFGIQQVHVQVVLSGQNIPDRTLSVDLAQWSQSP